MPPLLLTAHNPGPMTGKGNNTYLMVQGRSATLIDAGVGDPRHLADVAAALATAGAQLTHVLVTHGHPDHASGAPALAASYPAARFLKYPWPLEDGRYPIEWTHVGEGEEIPLGANALITVHTPGHSPDHLAFLDPSEGAIFAGDLLVKGSSVMIHTSKGGNLALYLASLERLLALDPRVIYPAHGPRIDDPHAVISAYLAHRRMREGQVLTALRAGLATVEAIADSIYDDLDPALTTAARENVRAHLEKLRAERRARPDGDEWRLD